MVVDMVADKKRGRHGVVHGGDINIIIHMEIKFGERVGHGCWLNGPVFFLFFLGGGSKSKCLPGWFGALIYRRIVQVQTSTMDLLLPGLHIFYAL